MTSCSSSKQGCEHFEHLVGVRDNRQHTGAQLLRETLRHRSTTKIRQ